MRSHGFGVQGSLFTQQIVGSSPAAGRAASLGVKLLRVVPPARYLLWQPWFIYKPRDFNFCYLEEDNGKPWLLQTEGNCIIFISSGIIVSQNVVWMSSQNHTAILIRLCFFIAVWFKYIWSDVKTGLISGSGHVCYRDTPLPVCQNWWVVIKCTKSRGKCEIYLN